MIRSATLSLAVVLAGAIATSVAIPSTVRAQEAQAVGAPVLAQDAPELHQMLSTMGIYDIIALVGSEGARGAADVEDQLFPGAGGAAWRATAMALHGTDRMVALFEDALNQDAVSLDQIAEVQAFMGSEVGQRLVTGEVAARRAFLDDDAVDAASEVFMAAVMDDSARLDILQRFNEINGLVDRNVTGALNLRFSFYRGLIEGGAFDDDVPEDLMLAEVWAQEPEMRQATVERLFSFQLLAYAEASDADLEAYIAVAASPAGRAVNATLFAAFDDMLGHLSYDLGYSAAGFIAGEDT